jgi:hypothetical protein
MKLDLDALGITREEVIDRVVTKITEIVMAQEVVEEGARYMADSDLAETLQTHVKNQIDAKVAELAEKFVLPDVGTLIENFTLQRTNDWGEKTGAKTTFVEYLVQRADAYIKEPVDFDGKVPDRNSYSKATQTRIAYMIEKHLHYHIGRAMESALQNANSAIAEGLLATVKLKLQEAMAGLSVAVKVGK